MTDITKDTQLDPDNPWPGLESFNESAHSFFYGRDHDAESLLTHTLDAPVTVLYGRSGLGKTSLLQAGLFPLLREQHFLPIYVRFEVEAVVAPLAHQLHRAIRDAIEKYVPDAMLPSDEESLWEYLHRADFELWSERNYLLTPLIVVDQFEELFTLGEPDRVQEFMNDFGDLVESRIPAGLATRLKDDETLTERLDLRSRNYKVLISLREDFLPELEEWRGLIPALGRSRVRLLPLSTENAVAAVQKPAAKLITEAQARRVVSIMAGRDLHRGRDSAANDTDRPRGEPGGAEVVEPALLSLVCRELNEERKRHGRPRFDEQLIELAKSDIISNYYSACVGDMPPRVARFIESELITKTGFRNSYALEDAVPSHITEDELKRLIDDFRLLRKIPARDGPERIELVHDVLTGVVREHRHRDAAARQLITEAKAMMGQKIPGGDARAWQQLLVARALTSEPDDEPLLDALVSRSRTLKIIDAGRPLMNVTYSLDGQRLATASRDQTVRLWDANTGQPVGDPLTGHTSPVNCVAFSPDGQRLASAGDDGTVRQWDARTGQPLFKEPLTGHSGFVFDVAFSPDGQRLASAGGDGTVRLWDATTGQPFGTPLTGHTSVVLSVAFSPNGKRLASASWDGTVRLWDACTGESLGEPLSGHRGHVRSVAFSPDGLRLASAGRDGTVRLWDADTGQPVGEPLVGHEKPVWSVAFSADGKLLASAGRDRTVRLWEARTGAPVGEPLTGHTSALRSVMFSPDGTQLASASEDGTVRVWDAYSRATLGEPLVRHTSTLHSVAFSPNGQRVATAGTDQTVRLWDARTGEPLAAPLAGHTGAVCSIAFSPPDGRRLASAGTDGAVQLWDMETGKSLRAIRSGHENVWSVALSPPDGRVLASAGDDATVRLWDAETGRPLGELNGPFSRVNSVAFSPDGRLLASAANDGKVRLWDAATGEPAGEPLTGHTAEVTCVTFSPDGCHLATASTDQTVWIWDARTGTPIGEPLAAHTHSVTCVAFNPDGWRVASGSRDRTVRVWDAHTGKPLGGPLTGHTGAVRSVAFSPDGLRLASAGDDGTVRIWPGAALPEMLCAKLSTNMSRQQWRQWVSPDIDYIPACPSLPIPPDDDSIAPTPEETAASWTLWEPCDDQRGAAALERLALAEPRFFARSTLVSARRSRLSFYEAHRLLELAFVRDHRTERAFALDSPRGTTLWLSGASAPIHDTNDAESLSLTRATVDEATVIDYIRFFLYFVWGEEGAFVLVDSSDQITAGDEVGDRAPDDVPALTLEAARAKARPPLMRGFDAEQRWLADTTIFYGSSGGALFNASLAVAPGGQIEMLDDEVIGHTGGLLVQRPPDLFWDPLATADPEELSQALIATEQLAAAHPDNPQYQRDLAVSHKEVGKARLARGEADGALFAGQRSVNIAERLVGAHPDCPQYRNDLAIGLYLVGDARMLRGEPQPALDVCTRAVDIAEQLAGEHPDDPDYQNGLAISLSRLGDVRVMLDDAHGALEAYTRCLDIAEKLTGDHPHNTEYQRNLAVCVWRTASIRESLGDPAADDCWSRAHQLFVALDSESGLSDSDREFLDELTRKLQGPNNVSDPQATPHDDVAAATNISQKTTAADPPAQVTATSLSVPRYPTSVAVDAAGNVYVTIDRAFKPRVLKFAAGSDIPTDLPLAGLDTPCAVAVDSDGAVYVADSGTNQVLKLANDVATPLPFSRLKNPSALAVDTAGNVYVADTGNRLVLRLGQNPHSLMTLPFANLEKPSGVAVDTAGNVYVADSETKRVLKLTSGYGAPIPLPFTDLRKVKGVAVDTAGNVYVGDERNVCVWKLAAGVSVPIKLLAVGSGLKLGDLINAVAVDAAQNVYVAAFSIPKSRIVIRPAGAT